MVHSHGGEGLKPMTEDVVLVSLGNLKIGDISPPSLLNFPLIFLSLCLFVVWCGCLCLPVCLSVWVGKKDFCLLSVDIIR